MKTIKSIMLAVVAMGICVGLHSSNLNNQTFSATLDSCVFTYTNPPLVGTYTGKVSGGTGKMTNLTTASGSFTCTDNGDGTLYVFTNSTSTDGTNRFTIRANNLVNLNTGSIAATTAITGPTAPPTETTFTAITLRIGGTNYSTKSASSGGTTDAANLNATTMNINGKFK